MPSWLPLVHPHPVSVVEPGGTSRSPAVRDRLSPTRKGKLWCKVCLHPHLEQGGMSPVEKRHWSLFSLSQMGANNSSLTPLNCILKNWDRFDPQGLKKTHLVFPCDTAWLRYPLEDGEQWPVRGSLKYNIVLQLDWFCRKQGKWVEVAYVLPFFALLNMPDLGPKGIDLDVKPSASRCPPTLPLYLGLQTEVPTVSVSVETQTETQTVLVSVETWTEIRTVHVEAQTTPVSVQLQTTVVSIETQTIKVRDEIEDRRQRDKEKQVSPIYPWDMCRAARETEEQPLKLLPLQHPPGEIISLWELINLFLIKKYEESRRMWETI